MTKPAANDSAIRVMDVMEVLCGFAITGASNKDLAEATGLSPSAITRCCGTLIAKGWCRKNEDTGRFYPTHNFTRLTFRVSADIQRAQDRLDDAKNSLTAI